MSSWLIFFSLFVKQYFLSLPQPFTVIPFFIFAYYLVYRIRVDRINLLTLPILSPKVVLYFSLLSVSEIFLLIWNYSKFGSTSQDLNVLGSFLTFSSLIFSFLFVWIILNFSINNDFQMKNYVDGTIKSFVFLFVIVLIPQLLVSTGHNFFLSWVNNLDKLFLPRWQRPEDYTQGSYVSTMHRVNGNEIEPAFLAGQLSIVFLPWILSAIKHRYSFFKNKYLNKYFVQINYLLLLLIFITLGFAKTTTGLLTILVTAVVLIMDNKGKLRRFFIYTEVFIFLLALFAYYNVASINFLLNNYLFAKGGFSAANRSGGTIGLFLTFLHYPLFGVGYGYIGHYLMEYVPRNSRLNNEYINGFSHNYVVLSNWGGFLAQYGIIFTLPIIRKVRELFYNFDHAISQDNFGLFIKDAAKYTMIFFAVLALFDFNWLSYYSLISVFVFGRFVQYRMSAKQVVKS